MERGVKGLSIIALVVSIIGLTIGFASLSQTLTINGSGKVSSSSNWDVKITDAELEGTGATTDSTKLTYTDSTVTLDTDGVTFSKPGDTITVTVTVTNNGTIDAKLGSITGNDKTSTDLTCKAGSTDSDYCGTNMTYSISGPEVNSELDAESTATYTITLKLNDTVEELPASDLTVTIPTLTINYVQA